MDARRHQALELRKKGLTLKQVGKQIRNMHTGKLGITPERARALIYLAERDIRRQSDPNDLIRIGLSIRAVNALNQLNVTTLKQLSKLSDKDLLALKNVGQYTLWHINKKLMQYNYPPIRKHVPRIKRATFKTIEHLLCDDCIQKIKGAIRHG